MNTTRENREQAGVCLDCGGPRTSEAKRCRACTIKQVEQNKKTKNTRQRRKEEGVCIDCGCPRAPKGLRCTSCRSRQADLRRLSRNEAKRRCPNCGGDKCNFLETICESCREDHPEFTMMMCVNSEFGDIYLRSGLTIPKFISTVEAIYSHVDVLRKTQSDTWACQDLDLLLAKSRAFDAVQEASSPPVLPM